MANSSETRTRLRAPFIRKFRSDDNGFRWSETDVLAYKADGTHFRDITRQILFGEDEDLPTQLRYFEIGPGGHSTLEKHVHVHAVLVLRGRGRVLLGDRIDAVEAFDAVFIPPDTWHQFRADDDQPLGFLCLVACDRDRPTRPDEEAEADLRADSAIDQFIRL